MPTLVSEGTFTELLHAHGELASHFGDTVAGIFVPWAGDELIRRGGIYVVGQATDGDCERDESQQLERCLGSTADLCLSKHSKRGSPFWTYLNGLTNTLLGKNFWECPSRWGWSNILNIGMRSGSPRDWPPEFSKMQSGPGTRSLREEFGNLRATLVAIVSAPDFGILLDAIPAHLQRHEENEKGIHWWWDPDRRNLYVHGNHPKYAQQRVPAQSARTIELAREYLTWPMTPPIKAEVVSGN